MTTDSAMTRALHEIVVALNNVAAAIRETNSIEACRVLKEKKWTASSEKQQSEEPRKTG